MNKAEIDKLFGDNMDVLESMDTHTNAAITGFLDSLEKNGKIYVRLHEPGSTKVRFSYLESDCDNWKDVMDKLAVRHGLSLSENIISTEKEE